MRFLFAAALVSLALPLYGASAPHFHEAVLNTISEELDRNFQILKEKADPAAYYLSCEVTELETHVVGATLGTITGDEQSRRRYLDVSVRVGTKKLDNYHRVRGERPQFTSGAALTIDDNPNAIRQTVWREVDRAYRGAAERLIKIRTNREVQVADRDKSDDFSTEDAPTHVGVAVRLKFSDEQWTDRLRRISKQFAKYPDLLTSHVQLVARADTRYFASSEGARIEHGRLFARIVISAQARAQDGMDLSDGVVFDSSDSSGLPNEKALLAAADGVAAHVEALLKAPVAEPFVGPAIFSGRASGVFFHEILGHRLEGHRQKDESEGQTFTKSVGEHVLPDFLSVVFDPGRKNMAGQELNGWYDYDDEGVAAKPLTAVDHGVLKAFLMSRSPIENFDHSNGHGRRQPGFEVVSRQSNLIVESARMETPAQLRAKLVEEIKRQKKPYGLYFEDVTNGYTTTSRAGLQAFKVFPVIVYRVYPDGRPDELIRGANIVGTPLASFAKILATSDKPEVFNGYCGAESGSIPVSAVSPAILISEIEIEKKDQSQNRPPLLDAPGPVAPGAVAP